MTAHSTVANIHLHGPIQPSGAVRNRYAHDTSHAPELYGAVDFDASQISGYLFVDSSAQAAALAEVFGKLAAELADAEQIIAEADAAAAAAERAAAEQAAADADAASITEGE